MQRVLPSSTIKARIGELAVGLAIDCDSGDEAIGSFLHSHLPDASMLPFAGFLTSDGQWIDGFSGYRDEAAFAAMLEAVAKSPLLNATPAVQQQLAKIAPAAAEAVKKGEWRTVLQLARQADATTGRCPERTAVQAAEKQARDWIAAQFAAVIEDAQTGKDLTAARQRLAEIKRRLPGEPEVADADNGVKALARLQQIRAAEAQGNAAKDLRSKAAAQFSSTRWKDAFALPETAKPTTDTPPRDGK